MAGLSAVYARLPVWAQNSAVSAYGAYREWIGFGPGYGRQVREYARRDGFSAAQWEEWQAERLRALLRDAGRHVPYYRDTWSADVRRAAEAGRLTELPLLDKEPLRAAPRDFVRDDRRGGRVLVHHTSGSTGTPIPNYWTIPEWRESRALREARSARWAGVSFSQPRATFSGRMVETDPGSTGPFHRYNRVGRQVYFSAFHLRTETAAAYVAALREHRVQWLTGYAFSYYTLAQLMLEQGLHAPGVRAVVTTSEKVTPQMRETMEAAYGCRVFEEYSSVENALFASECERGRLHVSPDAGIVEILRPDGSACEPGEPGEVVTTCLLRRHQPLIRFRLGDVATWDGEPCPCGRAMPVLREVVGRLEDAVVGPDGRRLVRFHGLYIGLPAVREGQVVQEALDRIRVRVVAASAFAEADREVIAGRVRERLGPGVAVVVEVVESIPRTRAGKFKAVVSLLGEPSAH